MLIKLLLAPILLTQGFKVRRNIVRLPEAKGQREGKAGDGETLKLMILGDSAAAGVGVDQQKDALSGQLAHILSQRYSLSWKLLAKTGETTHSVQHLLSNTGNEEFDVIVISLGVNDVTSGKSCRTFVSQTGELIARLEEMFSPKQIVFTGLPPMGHFPALPNPLRWYLGRQSQQFDRALKETVTALGWDYFSQDMTPEPHLIARDGFHPGAPVYKLWAQGVAQLIRNRF